jgi:acetoin utilization protein AcuC
LYQEELKEYDFGPGHHFRGNRYELFFQYLKKNLTEDDDYRIIKAVPATDEDLLLICEKSYIQFTQDYYKATSSELSYTGDFFKYQSADNLPRGRPGKVEEAARLVIGQAKVACDLVESREFEKAVSIGGGLHHAKRSYGEGFCLYNDVAFCAIYLMRKYGLNRIVILDTDAHAGNGTCEYFYQDPGVLFISVHQNPATIYPGTGFAHEIGAGKGKGFTVNIPMPIGAGNDSYQLVFGSIIEPIVNEFKPQIIIRNGGSDPHFDDRLTDLGLTIEGFRMIGERVRRLATICDGKVIDLIASGYNENILPRVWMALISGLANIKLEIEEPEPIPPQYRAELAFGLTEKATEKVVNEVRGNLKDYWRCFR